MKKEIKIQRGDKTENYVQVRFIQHYVVIHPVGGEGRKKKLRVTKRVGQLGIFKENDPIFQWLLDNHVIERV